MQKLCSELICEAGVSVDIPSVQLSDVDQIVADESILISRWWITPGQMETGGGY